MGNLLRSFSPLSFGARAQGGNVKARLMQLDTETSSFGLSENAYQADRAGGCISAKAIWLIVEESSRSQVRLPEEDR